MSQRVMARMLVRFLDRMAAGYLDGGSVDFSQPLGEPSVVEPGSISWQVFRNPVTMYVGGIAAVLLELGEPRVRHGVWDHSSFKRDPAGRLRRTGMAAMVTVYGARSAFERIAARVKAIHARIRGTTPGGQPYAADDPELLLWVQATASWAFLGAYAAYVRPLPAAERDLFYAEAEPAAALYGVEAPPLSDADMEALMKAMLPKLEPSAILDELLDILRTATILPAPLKPLQLLGVRAAIDLLPPAFRHRLGLDTQRRLSRRARMLLRGAALAAERVVLPSSPAAQAERRIAAPGVGPLAHRTVHPA